MTSNIGSQRLLEGIGIDGSLTIPAREGVLADLRRHFRPEFLSRVDETVIFTPLGEAEIERIVDLMLADLRTRLAERGIELELTEAARAFVAREGYDPVYGARPLRRFLQRTLETRLGREIIAGKIEDGAKVEVDLREGELVFETRAREAAGSGAGAGRR